MLLVPIIAFPKNFRETNSEPIFTVHCVKSRIFSNVAIQSQLGTFCNT
jgi:hypothetical protein